MMNSDIDVDIEEKHLPFAMVGFSSRKAPAKKVLYFQEYLWLHLLGTSF
jgi:hypothetical protein